MKVEDQKALAKAIIENLKQLKIFHEVRKGVVVMSLTEKDLENALYCAIASWNATEIKKLFQDMQAETLRIRKEYIKPKVESSK